MKWYEFRRLAPDSEGTRRKLHDNDLAKPSFWSRTDHVKHLSVAMRKTSFESLLYSYAVSKTAATNSSTETTLSVSARISSCFRTP